MTNGGNIFVRRPIFAMVIAIVIVILGAISIKSLPIEQYPDITPPMVQVSAMYQGADALTVEESVATPIEESVNGVSDMIYMESTSSSDGSMVLQVTFAVGTNPDMNTIFTQNRVATATPELPAIVRTQGVTTSKTQGSFVQVIALYSDNAQFDENFISNYAMINIQDRLARINGVGQVQVLGSGAYSMRIWIKPDQLDYLGITVSQIADAINAQSQVVPGGSLGGEPAPPGTQFTYTVRMPAQYNTAEQFGEIILRTNADGSLVKLKDVADIQLGAQTYDVNSLYQGRPGAVIAIYQAPGSNAVEVGSGVKAAMAELAQDFPDGMHYDLIVDSTRTIVSGVKEIIWTLIFALVLVIVVIYLFVQDWRATLVPVIAIPVSLIGAFMLFPLLNFSVNVFSLLGLVLAIGLVVDDAIVVVEAVQVNIEKGLSPRQATQLAMKSVSSPIIATTTVLMAVFLPVGLMPGAAGKLYQQFAITIALSVLISGINALSLSPALCSVLLKKRDPNKRKNRKGFFAWFNRSFNRTVNGYLKYDRTIDRHAWRTLIFVALLTGATLFFVKAVPTGFLPNEDQGYILTNIELPPAASLERTIGVVEQIYDIIIRNDNIEAVAGAAGFSILSGTQSPNAGIMFIKLKDYKQRKETAQQITDQLNGLLYEAVNGAQVYTFGPPSIPGLGPGSGFTIMIQDKGGNTPQYLADYVDKFIEAAKKRPEIATISTMYQAYVPQRAILIDNEKVLQAGVPLEELHAVLSTYLGGSYVNNFNRFGKLYQTYIQAESEYRQNVQDLSQFFVTSRTTGRSIPLSAFITVRDTVGAQFVNRFNLYRAASVTGLPTTGYSVSQSMDALAEVADEVLPSDMGYAWSNMSYQEANTKGEGTVFIYALIFVFLILAALYESWSLPLSILLGVPFAVFGAMLFIYVGYHFDPKYIDNIFLQVSLIMLIGLAAKNAILIIEYAKDQYDKGMSLTDAALEGVRLRIRPVVMTALAFIFGIMPLIFATGSNAVARNVMGLALCGGMFVATIIGLFVYPALFVVIGKWGHYDKKRERRKQEEAETGAAVPVPGVPVPTTAPAAAQLTSGDETGGNLPTKA